MTRTDEATMTTVSSRDGTEIAYFTSGDGPPLVMVHGTTADHVRWLPLLPHLEPHVTVHALDRRGRGASGDAADYDLEREFEDVAVVVDAIAAAAGGPVDVYGHSYGGACALGAATLTANVGRLILYEPPLVSDTEVLGRGVFDRLSAMLDAGDGEGALEVFMREVVQMDDETLRFYRAQPVWERRVAAAHTLPRESDARVGEYLDEARLASIGVPTLLLQGGDSPEFLVSSTATLAEVLPDNRVIVVPGQQHAADVLVPEVFASHMLAFLRGA